MLKQTHILRQSAANVEDDDDEDDEEDEVCAGAPCRRSGIRTGFQPEIGERVRGFRRRETREWFCGGHRVLR